ncbi:ADPGLC-PPase large subunit [Actinidia rufa]|uniref:glucose-1-phosphate adenylyltransferase n=1 Tax=Actinidia rufa TaxID=165716 RepID=A0A7J0EIS0_9ERIC|nr:ADPGLC-PPase large subunit [Actinidia rufa]
MSMDSCCASMRAHVHPAHVSRGDTGFWGERIRGSLKSVILGNQFPKSLKAKPGSAFNVLTSPDIDKEVLVPIGGCYRLIDVPMSNCINSGIRKIFILTQFNSFSLNRHLARTYNFGNGITFADGFVEKHIDTHADITVSCVPMNNSRASDYGLVKIDKTGRIIHFAEKPKGPALKQMRVDTSLLGLSEQDATEYPYIASMGVYVFRTDVLLKLLRWRYPSCNDFGSEIIPYAVSDHNVQAYLFNDYWEDIGTIKSFFDANLALTEQPPKFDFNDPKTPFFTSPRFLPPTKMEKCRIVDAIVSHGCFLNECNIQHSIVGVRSRLETGVELQDTMMMGADYYQTEAEIASQLAEGKVPIGVGRNTKIRNCIIDKNAKIGRDVIIANKDGVDEADRPEEGFYIRSGITVVLKNATIKDGTIV